MNRLRQKYLLLVFLALWLPLSACHCPTSQETKTDPVKQETRTEAPKTIEMPTTMYMTFQEYELTITLENNEYVSKLIQELPLTLTIEDFQNSEKIASLSDDFIFPQIQTGFDPIIGDVAIYAPWGNLAIYYQDQPYATGLIPIGHIQSGSEYLSSIQPLETIQLSLQKKDDIQVK